MARILIVDDQPFNVDLLEQELEALEYETAKAYDGQQALDQVEAFEPDLILLDVMMPVLDGFEVCRILKGDPQTALIPILIMTALDDIDDRIRGIEAGADDFLTKPVDERELKARIETALRLRTVMLSKISDAGKKGRHYEKFVPEAVKRRVEENPDRPELEKREEDASILFLDIVGYTRLSEALSPTALSELVERYFSLYIDHLHALGGDITESSGDGLMVMFQDQDPKAHALRAIEASQRIFAETARLNAEAHGPAIALHMGINSGLAHVGSTRYQGQSGTRWVFTADGFVVNLAARLASVAEAGELCVAAETVDRVGAAWEFEDLGPKAMKNVAEPTRVFRLIRRREAIDDRPSIVVLPIDNVGGEEEHELLCEGLGEDLIDDLSRIEGLMVIALGSARSFRPTDDPKEICAQLDVGHALVGSLAGAETGLRAEWRLVDASGSVAWDHSRRFAPDALLEVRDEVVTGLAERLAIPLTPDDQHRLTKRRSSDFAAWKHYHRAMGCHREFTRESNMLALRRLDLALGADPGFARAMAMKSRCRMLFFVNDWGDDPERALREAHDLARAAIALDDDEPVAWTSLSVALVWMRELDEARTAARWALQRAPNHVPALVSLGGIHHYLGEHREAVDQLRRALKLDPRSPPMYLHILAQAQYGCRAYREAAVTLNRRLSKSGNSDASRVLLAACYGQLGEPEKAREQWEEALAINPDYSLAQKRRALPYRDPADFDHMVAGLEKAGLLG